MPAYREDDAIPWHKTDAGRRHLANYQAKRRAQWRDAGLCVECGKPRKWPTLRCAYCLTGNVIRVERAVYKRMAKAELRSTGR